MVYVDPDLIWIVVVGFLIAFVLAIGIGANDVANTFGTSVGSGVLTLRQACVIASVVETLGAILLGAKVTDTIRKGIIDIAPYENETAVLMVGNVAALTGSCVWLFIATVFKMPVSGTHSIVGATVGFALVAHGAGGVDWKKLGFIISSWFISPVMSGAVSVALFLICKYFILFESDPLEPGLRFLPIFYACTIVVNFFSIFYDGTELLGFDRIPLWGVFILSFGGGIVTALGIRFLFVSWQRKTIKEKVKRMKEQEALMSAEDQQQSVDEITKLEPIMEEDNPNEDKSSSLYNDAVLVSKSGEPVVPKRRVTIVDCYTNGAGDLSTTVDVKDDDESPQNNSGDADHSFQTENARSRSKSMVQTTPTSEFDRATGKRARSKSESVGDHALTGHSRARAYSISIDDLHDRRLLPVDKSMALNIEKRAAEEEEAKLVKQGLPDAEIAQKTREVIEDKPEQYHLFAYLQILTAIFGGFAHGGNDVSNAIGPLVSIWTIGTSVNNQLAAAAPAPLWILFYGGVGISIGLWIWGRRVIKTMGQDLAKITPSTGFCIELGAAMTVLTASNLGLPISTTHCKVGSVVFVGWTRSRQNVDWKLFSSIFLAWILTLPVAGGVSAAVMAGLMQLV